MTKDRARELLAYGSYVQVSLPLAVALDNFQAAGLLSYLIFLEKEQGQWFSVSYPAITKKLAIKRVAQDKCFEILSQNGLAFMATKGKNKARYVRIPANLTHHLDILLDTPKEDQDVVIKPVDGLSAINGVPGAQKQPTDKKGLSPEANTPKAAERRPNKAYELYEIWADSYKKHFPNLPVPLMGKAKDKPGSVLRAGDRAAFVRLQGELAPFVAVLLGTSEGDVTFDQIKAYFGQVLDSMEPFHRKAYMMPAKLTSNLHTITRGIISNTTRDEPSNTENRKPVRPAINQLW